MNEQDKFSACIERLQERLQSFERRTPEIKTGDYVFYFAPDGATVPARVLSAGKVRLLVEANFNEGTRRTWVTRDKCEMQYIQVPTNV